MSLVAETDQNQLRAQHYVFAHYTLREEAFEATAALLAALANQDHNYMREQRGVSQPLHSLPNGERDQGQGLAKIHHKLRSKHPNAA